ncbi:MAG: GPR endopeptidase [Clostridiaceae bacterium]
MDYYNIRTDLALEAKEIVEQENKSNSESLSGVKVDEKKEKNVDITIVEITNEKGEKAMGRPIGKYITIEIPDHAQYDGELMDEVSEVLAKELTALVKLDKDKTALVVGLGNWNVTPDALGPKVISKLMVTRHLKQLVPDSIDEEIRPVCALSPGVLGITGIETGEIIKGVVERIKPSLIICVDALASRKLNRVNSTIQIGTTGISPGAGVGNHRMEITEKTLGVPVIAIGVPTVVHAATMANDTIDLVLDEMIGAATEGSNFYNMLRDIDKEEKHELIKKILEPHVGDLIVTPKDVDMVIDSISKVIANGINIALQPALDIDDINSYLT